MKYAPEVLDKWDDNGTMPDNVAELESAVVGHKIVDATRQKVANKWSWRSDSAFVLTLDNGKQVILRDTDDCCAFTELESFLVNVENIDHVITGVGTTDGFSTWHIYADLGDVVQMNVGWSSGNPFYYGYGFEIEVQDAT
jgi:hypothetical protein